jgi:hypothetical protein
MHRQHRLHPVAHRLRPVSRNLRSRQTGWLCSKKSCKRMTPTLHFMAGWKTSPAVLSAEQPSILKSVMKTQVEKAFKRANHVGCNGLFTISGYKGERLSFVPEKTGYVLTSHINGGIYSPQWPEEQRVHPDPNNPVIIKMWKLQGGESLIHFSYNVRVPYDNTPVLFDFQTGKTVNTGGDLVIKLQCPLTPDTREQYDWQAIIQPVDGGIVSDDGGMELKFQAPDSGYESEFDIKNRKDVRPWSSTFHGGLFFKSRGGNCYGKLDLGIVIYAIRDGLVPITLDGYINPAGSRNLEIDPAKITEAHP